jgi:uncharacterized protein
MYPKRALTAPRFAAIALLLPCGSPLGAAVDPAYVKQIEKWRQEFDADVRTGGWLTLVGRMKLDGRMWTLGSDPLSTIPLPSQAPAHLGVLRRQAEQIRFEPARGTNVTVDGTPTVAAVELSTKTGRGKIQAQGLELHVRLVGGDPYLFVIDPNTAAVAAFKGTNWYPIDPVYRISATFEPYPHERLESVPLTHVESKESFPSTGDVIFQLNGRAIRLKTFIDEGQLFVMFLDETNGRGTYGGGRFLHAPLPRNGQTILDFNKAFNPYCSLNPNVMCPIPPSGNRLSLKVSAGETFTPEPW